MALPFLCTFQQVILNSDKCPHQNFIEKCCEKAHQWAEYSLAGGLDTCRERISLNLYGHSHLKKTCSGTPFLTLLLVWEGHLSILR